MCFNSGAEFKAVSVGVAWVKPHPEGPIWTSDVILIFVSRTCIFYNLILIYCKYSLLY